MLSPLEVAALTEAEFKQGGAGMAVMRIGYDGLRRNALYAIGMTRTPSARPLVERLCDDPSPVVADAARWALARLT
jgi:epoxyqueuosine reductase